MQNSWECPAAFTPFSFTQQPYGKVDDDGEYSADYQAGYNRKEKLGIPPLQEYVARQLSQERNAVPESQ